jgi:uncharacterized protein YigE (DUF2233 family)
MFPYKSALSTVRKHEWICLLAILFLPILSALMFPDISRSQTNAWREAGEGLYVGELDVSPKFESSDSKITVIKIDPRYYSFQLLCGSEHGRERLTVKDWSQKYNLVAAVNAGMFQEDGFRSVGYMKNFDHVINSRISRDNTILAFNRLDPDVPEIQIIDRECQDFDSLKRKYSTMIQSIRMISCDQENVWSQQPTKWSTVAIATDEEGKVLFLFTRSPYSVHDFIEILLSLPLSIHSAMYLEGGPQASMYLSTEKVQIERYGVWESVLDEASSLQIALPIPNVIGIVKKPQ